MQYRHLGRTGLKVAALCLGAMQFGQTCDEATPLSPGYETRRGRSTSRSRPTRSPR